MPDLSIYTIGTVGGAMQTLESLGIEEVSGSFKSRAIGTISFAVPVANAAAAAAFPHDSTIRLKQGEAQIFYGTIQEAPRSIISGSGEAHSYIVVDPWWHLAATPYQQSWKVRNNDGSLGTEHRSRLTLFQDINGNKIKTGAQIVDALEWAIAAGAPFQIGDILEGVFAPTRDLKDATCEGVIKQALLWTPDAVTRFDFSTTPPTLHIRRQADLGSTLLSMADGRIADTLDIRARYDLQVPSVTVKYEQTHTDDGNTWSTTSVDTHPGGATEQAPKAIVVSMELSGSQAARQKQAVVTKPIPEWNGSNASTIIRWMLAREPWLRALVASSDDLELVAGSYYAAVDTGPDGEPQKKLDGSNLDVDIGDVQNELIAGSITDWMQLAYPNLEACYATVGCALRWKNPAALASLSEERRAEIKQAFYLVEDTADANYNKLWRYVGIVATNASTNTYSVTTSFDPGETPPNGVAQALYQALGALYHDVTFTMVEDEITWAIGVGENLHLADDREEYLTMAAPVQEISWSLASGRTTVKCGPPEHLGVQDIVEYLRGLRNTERSLRAGDRATGEAPRALTVYGNGWTPRSTTPNPPGGGGGSSVLPWTPFQVVVGAAAEDGTGQVSISEESKLYRELGVIQPITGLGAAFPVVAGDRCWLEIAVTSAAVLTPSSASIQHGASWDGVNPVVLNTEDAENPFQEKYLKLIFEAVATDDAREGIVVGTGEHACKIIPRLRQSLLCTIRADTGMLLMVPEEMGL